jgi:hypothetical protein
MLHTGQALHERKITMSIAKREKRSFRTMGLVIGLVGVCALLQAGCGCRYGVVDPPTVTPDMECLDVRSDSGSCAVLELTVFNNCTDALVFTSETDTLTVEPGTIATVIPGQYGEIHEDNDTCRGVATIPATLGATEIEINFGFEMVNRGLGGC